MKIPETKVIINANAKPGDKLILTKPLGTGFITTAAKKRDCPEETYRAACISMVELNKGAAEAMLEVGVNAATDITGFGLAGHAFEMASGSGVTFVIHLNTLPLFPALVHLVPVHNDAAEPPPELERRGLLDGLPSPDDPLICTSWDGASCR